MGYPPKALDGFKFPVYQKEEPFEVIDGNRHYNGNIWYSKRISVHQHIHIGINKKHGTFMVRFWQNNGMVHHCCNDQGNMEIITEQEFNLVFLEAMKFLTIFIPVQLQTVAGQDDNNLR